MLVSTFRRSVVSAGTLILGVPGGRSLGLSGGVVTGLGEASTVFFRFATGVLLLLRERRDAWLGRGAGSGPGESDPGETEGPPLGMYPAPTLGRPASKSLGRAVGRAASSAADAAIACRGLAGRGFSAGCTAPSGGNAGGLNG
uniref:Uncharacterized protein n=1 Tax=Heterosigma akashiwo TaxID=2829 RepID=A0A7S3UP38_HETAK